MSGIEHAKSHGADPSRETVFNRSSVYIHWFGQPVNKKKMKQKEKKGEREREREKKRKFFEMQHCYDSRSSWRDLRGMN